MLKDFKNDFEKAQALQNVAVSIAIGDKNSGRSYSLLRQYFVGNTTLKDLLPEFIRINRESDQFWQYIKHKFSSWNERRTYIWNEFSTLLEYLEKGTNPIDENTSKLLKEFDEANVHAVWQKALERRTADPEGAITLARTLLETICKHILDAKGISYGADVELHALYKLTANELNLAASQHTEDVFKQILGGCAGIVSGLGTLRNRLGDAHGQGKNPVKPAPRHAELAVNIAGAMSLFLVSTWQEKNNTTQ